MPRLRRRQLHRACRASSRRSTRISRCSASDPTTSATTTSRSPTSSSRRRSTRPTWVRTTCAPIVYTGGTTGRPKGVLMTHRVWQAMTWIQMAEWEFPDELRIAIATPLSHAAMSLVAPVLLSGGAFYVMESFDPDGFFDLVERASHHGDADRPRHAVRAAGASSLRDGRHVVDGDHLLRGVADEPGQARPGDRALGSDLLPVLRADRGADGDHPPEEGRARSRPPRPPRLVRPPGAVDARRPARRRQPTGRRRASRARSAPAVRW